MPPRYASVAGNQLASSVARMATRYLARSTAIIAAALAVAAALGTPVTATATAADDAGCEAAGLDVGVVGYGCGDTHTDDGDGDESERGCELTAPARYCVGDLACWTALPSPIPDAAWPSPPPAPDAVWTYRFCAAPEQGYRAYWHWHVPPREQDHTALGRLSAPGFTLRSNPPGLSVVNLATWFWVDGAGESPIRGTVAAGLVVIGTPARIELDPGDGGETLRCPWSSTESDRCAHTYRRSSADSPFTSPKGQPAFQARARLVYTLQARRDGRTVDLPGLPDELRSAWSPTPVPVAEVQTVTTPGRA